MDGMTLAFRIEGDVLLIEAVLSGWCCIAALDYRNGDVTLTNLFYAIGQMIDAINARQAISPLELIPFDTAKPN
jgi:hypothetical protein